MAPTTRRVTAQRKFAQGAYVPPTAVAAVPGPGTTNNTFNITGTETRSNVLHNNMPASSFLDLVSFQNSHANLHDLHPVVLLERLSELKQNNKHRRVRNNSHVGSDELARDRRIRKRRAAAASANLHNMTLRTRTQRNVPKKYLPMPDRIVKKKVNRVSRRIQPKRVARVRYTSTSDFSVDDNRPLTYFRDLELSTDQTLLVPTSMGPPIRIPRQPQPSKRTRKSVYPQLTPTQYTTPQRQYVSYSPTASQSPSPLIPNPSDYSQVVPMSSVQAETRDMQLLESIREPFVNIDMKSDIDDESASEQRENELTPHPDYGTHYISMNEHGYLMTPSDHAQINVQESPCINTIKRSPCIIPGSITNNAAVIAHSINNQVPTISGAIINHGHPGMAVMPRRSYDYYTNEKSIERWLDITTNPRRIIARPIDDASDIVDMDGATCRKRPSVSTRRSSIDSVAIEKANAKAAFEAEMVKRNNVDERIGKISEAPTFWPTREEFKDPLVYFEKIMPEVAKYGICKIVPPDNFMPPCKCDDDIRFKTSNQYTSRLFNRWGSASREICAIKACLKAHNIEFDRQPIFGGVEISLPKLYHLVQRYGGLENVINKKKWGKIVEELTYQKNPLYERNLEKLYIRYLLPYNTISPLERHDLFRKLEAAWMRKSQKLLDRANNPYHRQKVLMAESEESSDNEEDETDEIDDCTTNGETMNLAKFKSTAGHTYYNIFRNRAVNTTQIEKAYWKTVLLGNEHICVYTASIDTSSIDNLGFTYNKHDSYVDHPWNLKVLSKNPRNVLRSLGRVIGVTVPTFNFGMVFATNCWHRDPHHLPWIEYLHSGSPVVRYGIPECLSDQFRRASEILSPTSCQNKPLWLPSDITMIPPAMLAEHNVNVYKLEQNPGEFVIVMPRAYSCSVSTGFSASESVYFATETWLDEIGSIFAETHDSCEPTMFALEHLLKSIAEDPSVDPKIIQKILPLLESRLSREIEHRLCLEHMGVKSSVKTPYDTPVGVEPPQNESEKDSSAAPPPPRPRTCRQLASKKKRPKAVVKRPAPRPTTPPSPTPSQPSPQTPQPTPPPAPPPTWSFGTTAECEVCRCMLYLSKVGKFPFGHGALCVEHAIEILSKPKYADIDIESLEMHYRFSNQELQETILKASKRLVDAGLKVSLDVTFLSNACSE